MSESHFTRSLAPITLFIFLSTIFSPAAYSQSLSNDFPSNAAEYVYYSTNRLANLSQWVSEIPVTREQRSEISAYLKAHHEELAPLPTTRWKPGSPVIRIDGPGHSYNIDFSMIASRHAITIDNHVVNVDPRAKFADIVESIRQTMVEANAAQASNDGAFQNFLIPSAHAVVQLIAALAVIAVIGLAALYAIDQGNACFGNEDHSVGLCHLRSDAGMIRADTGDETKLTGFSCSAAGQLLSIDMLNTETSKPLREGFSFEYDAQGRLIALTELQAGENVCKYTLDPKTGRISNIENILSMPDFCDLTEVPDDGLQPALKTGDALPRTVGVTTFPIHRGMSCCMSASCRSEMLREVSKNTAGGGSSSSRPNANVIR